MPQLRHLRIAARRHTAPNGPAHFTLTALPLQIAKRQGVVNPENTFFSVKRFIGSKYAEVSSESQQVPYKVVKDDQGNVKIASSNAGKDFAPEEISAAILRKLVDDASAPLPPQCMLWLQGPTRGPRTTNCAAYAALSCLGK